ncbi:hypothetical protein N9S97_00740 [Candidatus Pelagibacter sp.]|nr:hypothetical protein [Candidatus Pelagibacter sp.]
MKKILAIMVLGLLLSLNAKAENISDFQIEGMSIGESALKYFSESEIKKNAYKTQKKSNFTQVTIKNKFNEFERIAFNYLDDDNEYKFHAISGRINFKNNINECLIQMDEIISQVNAIFKEQKKVKKKKKKYRGDKTGKSKITLVNFQIDDGGLIHVACYDFSKKMKWPDGLNVSIGSKEWNEFQKKKAFK